MPENDRFAMFWQVPATPASPGLAADSNGYAHLRQVAIAADRLGFDGLLLPSGAQSEEAWTYAAAIAPFTERLRFLIPVRPGGMTVAAAARLAASLDRITDGRVLLHLETRPAAAAQAAEAVDPELAVFLAEWRRHTDMGGLEPGHRRLPALWLPESALAITQARAEHGETCVIAASSSEQVRSTVAIARARAAAAGRLVRFAVRLHLVLRPTDEAAAEAARALRPQEVGPILAGSPGLVAARLMEFRAAGVETVIASGSPPLEEAYRVAELLFPLLPAQAPAPAAPRIAGGFSLSELRMAAL
jgi:alkanesulfonate monooxygenase